MYLRAAMLALLLVAAAPAVGADGNGSASGDETGTADERIEALREAIREERSALEQERERRREVERDLSEMRSALERARGEIDELRQRIEAQTGDGGS